jgi:hypothetical protein
LLFRTSKFVVNHDLTRAVAAFVTTSALLIPLVIQSSAADSSAAAAEAREASQRQHEQLAVHRDIVRDTVERSAKSALTSAQNTVQQVNGKTDTAPLTASIDKLGDYRERDIDELRLLTSQTKQQIDEATAAAAEHDRQVAAQKAAEAAAAAAAAAQALANANTPDGARQTARSLAASEYGWGDDQFQCLDSLWTRESNWNYQAYNAGSGAAGIPQALPGSKMASVGSDWQTNAATQIKWGLGYIAGSYGTPCAAWGHSEAMNWY